MVDISGQSEGGNNYCILVLRGLLRVCFHHCRCRMEFHRIHFRQLSSVGLAFLRFRDDLLKMGKEEMAGNAE